MVVIIIENKYITKSEENKPPSTECAITQIHNYRIEKIEEMIIKNQEDMRNQLNRIEKQLEHLQKTQQNTAKDLIEQKFRIEQLEKKFGTQERYMYLIISVIITQLVIIFLPRLIR